MNKTLVSLLVGGALLGQACASFAVQFASFQQSTSINGFYYSGTNPPGTSTLVNGPGGAGVPVAFAFTNLLGGALPGIILTTNPAMGANEYDGILTISGSATTGEVPKNSHQNRFDSMTITITAANTPKNVAANLYTGGVGKILLKVTAGQATDPTNPKTFGGLLTAIDGQNSATLAGSNPFGETDNFADFVNFTSQAIDTSNLLSQAYGLSFSAVTGPVSYHQYGAGPLGLRRLNNFNANGTGTFSADSAVPEPGSLSLAIGSLISCSLVGIRRRRK